MATSAEGDPAMRTLAAWRESLRLQMTNTMQKLQHSIAEGDQAHLEILLPFLDETYHNYEATHHEYISKVGPGLPLPELKSAMSEFLNDLEAFFCIKKQAKQMTADSRRSQSPAPDPHPIPSAPLLTQPYSSTPEPSPGIHPNPNPQGPLLPFPTAYPYPVPNFRLPKLELPRFEGEIHEWQTFWDLFDSAFHRNPTLQPVEKMAYLRSCLRGDALKAIRSLSLTSQNYDYAVATLTDRFGKPDLLIPTRMLSLLELPSVKCPTDATSLRRLYDACQDHMQALKNLQVSPSSYSPMFAASLLSKLHNDLSVEYNRRTRWAVNLETLLNFLLTEVEALEGQRHLSREQKGQKSTDRRHLALPTTTTLAVALPSAVGPPNPLCQFCNSSEHHSNGCSLSLSERRESLKQTGRCFNCLDKGHMAIVCPRAHSKFRKCNGSHHTTICQSSSDRPPPLRALPPSSVALYNLESAEGLALQTALVNIHGPNGTEVIRCIFDGGSQRSYITRPLSKRLRLDRSRREPISVTTFASSTKMSLESSRVKFTLNGLHSSSSIETHALEVPFICPTIPVWTSLDVIKKFPERCRPLADPSPANNPRPIELFIGADSYWDIVTGEIERIPNGPVLSNSLFGWLLLGPIARSTPRPSPPSLTLLTDTTSEPDLNRFWDLESIGVNHTEPSNQPDDPSHELIKQSLTFEGDRYTVSLPWKEVRSELPDNLQLAESRLRSTLKRLHKNPSLLTTYSSIITDYLARDFIEPVNPPALLGPSTRIHYLPHHPVIRLDKTTTKVRMVFDGSAKLPDHPSLNDCLESGPNLTPDILEILLRFRTVKYPIIGDIQEAFPQIGINEDDRDALRFLWVPDSGDSTCEPLTFRWRRVPFGLTCSPALLAVTLHEHFRRFEPSYPLTVDILKSNTYVDDVFLGGATREEALTSAVEAKRILNHAGMNLRKFTTADPHLQALLVESLGEESIQLAERDFSSDTPSKVLGLRWNLKEDAFYFDASALIEFSDQVPFPYTKRIVLKLIARLFDPLGFLGPVSLAAKIFMQTLWQLGIAWYDPLPLPLAQEVKNWVQDILSLTPCLIPRFIVSTTAERQIHLFCDASEKGYATVAYLRTIDGPTVRVFLLASKTRVSPLKRVSIPRLELLGALLSARFSQYLNRALATRLRGGLQFVFWTKSQVALGWIRGAPHRWKTFIANRVQEIQNCSPPSSWRYCPGPDNPADVASRGELASNLVAHPVWWQGPLFLQKSEIEWPTPPEDTPDLPVHIKSEAKGSLIAMPAVLVVDPQVIPYEKFSSYTRLVRVVAWTQRFLHNSKSLEDRRTGPLTTEEVKSAEIVCVRQAQKIAFSLEYEELKGTHTIPKSSPLRPLNPVFNPATGLLLVAGRLRFVILPEFNSRPILLPHQHPLTTLAVRYHHVLNCHCGVRDTLLSVRSSFWIPRGKQLVKSVLHRCSTCKQLESRPYSEPVAPLPLDRTTPTAPFDTCGVDFAGPLLVKSEGGSSKTYICLFTCSTTRALHLELVTDLSTPSFLLAFRRLISRRGVPSTIYSDNALTFKRAQFDLHQNHRSLRTQEVLTVLSGLRITWKFIVERAPWWGRFYERMVRSVKQSLKKVIGRSSLR